MAGLCIASALGSNTWGTRASTLSSMLIGFQETSFYTTPNPKARPKHGIIKASLDLFLAWGGGIVPYPKGPYTAHLKTLAATTIPGMVLGTRVFKWAVCGLSSMVSYNHAVSWQAASTSSRKRSLTGVGGLALCDTVDGRNPA